MIQVTYADLFRPRAKRYGLFYDAILVVGGSFLVALCAQLALYLPFSPIPITMQTFGVILAGALLGSKRGAISMFLYLLEGVAGLPVFAGANFGIATLIGPTGGYLFGFIAAAFIVGWMAERGWDRRYWSTVVAMLMGTSAIFIFGLARLVDFVGIDLVFKTGLYPFLPGAIIKIGLAAVLLPTGWKLLGMRNTK